MNTIKWKNRDKHEIVIVDHDGEHVVKTKDAMLLLPAECYTVSFWLINAFGKFERHLTDGITSDPLLARALVFIKRESKGYVAIRDLALRERVISTDDLLL